jgi:DNA-binding NtrC family response regulator
MKKPILFLKYAARLNMMDKRILFIEDEERMRHLLELVLVEEGYTVETASDGMEGIALWQKTKPDVVLTDLKMPRADGLEVLDFRNRQYQQVPLIILTAFGTVQSAVTAMKHGAYDYLIKPVDNDHLIDVVARAIADTSHKEGSFQVLGEKVPRMVGSSQVMKKIYEDIAMVGCTRMSVLITGESGTGKELAAAAIHANSERPGSPFIRVNCAAIPRDLLESELYGHVRGAFTGAVGDRQGAFVQADGGSIFLDEIGDLPLEMQPKLLHAVEMKSVTPVGSAMPQEVDVRIIAATNKNLDEMVQQGSFRGDLFHRLNRYPFHLPPLRIRGNDLAELIDYYIDLFCREQGKNVLTASEEALALLQEYSWPGNVRELSNILERNVLTCRKGIITAEMLPDKIRCLNVAGKPDNEEMTDLSGREKQAILAALEQCSWNQSEAARKLGVSRNTLRYRMKKHEIMRMDQGTFTRE